MRSGRGRKTELDAARGLELAREPGSRLALLLEPLAERPALAVGLGQRAAQRGRVDHPQPERRRQAVEQVRELPVGHEAPSEQRRAEAERQERRASIPTTGVSVTTSMPAAMERLRFGPSAQRGRTEDPAVEHVLERLGVDLDPGRLSPSGVTCWSPKPRAVTPTRTSFRSRRSAATSPASTAAAETYREPSCGVKWIHIVPSASGGDPDVADAHRAHATCRRCGR